MEYLNRLEKMHRGAAELLAQVVKTQKEIRFFEDKQKQFVEVYEQSNPQIALNLLEARRVNNRLLHSYKKTIKQINIEL